MSNYNIQIAWNGKDALPDSDPAKVISGADFQTEFEAVQTAINSKPDTATVLPSVYPVGSIYINAAVSTNPSTLFGFGTWVAFGTGRVLVGVDSGDASFDTLGEEGGSKDAIVVSHTHTASTNTTGDHYHQDPTTSATTGPYELSAPYQTDYNYDYVASAPTSTAGAHSHTVTVDSTGSSGTNANLQPYITVYMWKRTA